MKRLGYTSSSRRAATGARRSRRRWACRRPRGCSASTPTCRAPRRPSSSRASRPATRRRPDLGGRRAGRVRAAAQLLREARRLRADHVDAAADHVRARGLADRSRGVRDRSRRRHRPARPDRAGPRRDAAGRAHPGRRPRQHHALLADEHRRLRGPPLLGEQGGLLRRQADHDPVRHQRVPGRALPGAAQLGRARLPGQPHPLQPARPRRPLRRLGAAAALLRGDARGFRTLRS